MTTAAGRRTAGSHPHTSTGSPVPRIYDATTTHRRSSTAPAGLERRFSYRTCYWLIDADDPPALPALLRRLIRFEARDHLGDPAGTMAGNARALLAEQGLSADRIMLLTCPRTFGHVFNPLSVFYCLRREPPGVRLVAVIAEVHNTYGGRHAYLLRPDQSSTDSVEKAFYVSPFLPLVGMYTIRTPMPLERLAVTVSLRQGGATSFVATLRGSGRPLSGRSATRALIRWPMLTLRTAALIRWQGIRLWLRRVPVQQRPADAATDERGR